jgi:ketosteroid isomerase-like protein
MRIDPTRTWRLVEERLAREREPRRRRNLETLLAHMRAETAGDLDALMATVAEDAAYKAYGSSDPLLSPQGKAAVREFYTAYIASGAHRLEFDVDRLVVDEDCVVTEGMMRIAYPANVLALIGRSVPDPERHYLYEARMVVLWPMDADGLVMGEDSYVASDGFVDIGERPVDLD